MSDMLQKLLAVEKDAARLVAEAEAEAVRRTAEARADVHRKHSDALKSMAAGADAAVGAERERLSAERVRKNGEFREELARRRPDTAAFQRAIEEFLERGGK